MIEKTKSVNKVVVKNKKLQEKIAKILHISSLVGEMIYVMDEKLNNQSEQWVRIENKALYYVPEDKLLMVNPRCWKLDTIKFSKIKGMNMTGMQKWVIDKWFVRKKYKNPIIDKKEGTITYVASDDNKYSVHYIYCEDTKQAYNFQGEYRSWGMHSSNDIKIPICILKKEEQENVIHYFFEHELNVFEKGKFKNLFELLVSLQKNGFFAYSKDGYRFNVDALLSECKKYDLFDDFDEEEVWKTVAPNSDSVLALIRDMIINELLSCDEERVNMEKYPVEIIESPEFGHWELWEDSDDERCVYIENGLVARNPVYDALENKSGVIGIDFGTKSTVVTYRQSRADVLPMRIGSGKFSRSVSQNDYENPTVMELRDVESFLEAYNQCEGRPCTKWEDLLISHEAAEQLKSEQGRGETFATFFSELKQWSGDKTRQVKLRDLQGKEINIPSYLQLSKEDFDPIEIYAYYMGLFINNMLHKIYLRYKLAFPATIEKAVRDKLLDSFTRGIKKSLPQPVIDSKDCMKLFKVEQGVSEPAAYAISALQEYGFDPEENEKHYYGIFDFGGGTTDFDFGVWSSEIEEPENYDYQISHFGQGGDPYLGGENILGLMAYSVFNENYNKLLEDEIVFVRPYGEKEVAGKDWLVKQDSQYAHFNHKRLMEKLRGVWENDDEIIEQVEGGIIELPLFNKDGELKQNYILEISLETLNQIISDRIENGIVQFFSALKNCFGVSKNKQYIFDINEINVFLAGNSSKSLVVMNLFKKYIDALNKALSEHSGKNKNWINIYPPLGTSAADAVIRQEIKPFVDEIIKFNSSLAEEKDNAEEDFCIDRIQKPTGKTGVAFGLLNNRVRVVQDESDEITFRYYIGQNRKNKFFCVIDKDKTKYGEWNRFCLATREEFDIWFTRSADAPANKLPIDQIGIYSEIGFVDKPTKEKSVFIRLAKPTDIEYVVASEDEIKNGNYSDSEITLISLQEKQ